ncbi:hypothetical protein PAGU2196_23190 [Pseudomonas sp. PAGU 2196]|uniref:hypothetical protein n=1 Tax=Pseudomonas sp. PAGU 2196 TaxID=2793997 RepID=UPI001EDFFA1E|nr:hypothetical protein [Pseudomonas sp. PAGU 2196]GHS81485.1 hypothetical protein PAGU2196_23190 [Pseudomonas sp. PAGU 2196]
MADDPIVISTRRTREDRILQGLAAMQHDIELGRDEALKRQRRAVLRGMRAGVWADGRGLTTDEVLQGLRAELFGWPLKMLPAHDDDESVPMGTTTEVIENG